MLCSENHACQTIRDDTESRYRNKQGGDQSGQATGWYSHALAWVAFLPERNPDNCPEECCAICHEDFGVQRLGEPSKPWVKVIPCGHAYDTQCLVDALASAQQFPWICPYDRPNMIQIQLDQDS